jgi:drug/metabolite transporter (DMT)-like permease
MFWIAALLSVIGGIVIGVEAGKQVHETNDLFSSEETTYDGTSIITGIFIGLLAAALWAGLAVGLRLVAEIADNTRPMWSREQPPASQPSSPSQVAPPGSAPPSRSS